MGSHVEPGPEFIDTGTAPEFFIEAAAKREYLPGGLIRTYVCTKRGGLLIPQYIFVASVHALAGMAADTLRACQRYDAEVRKLGLSADHLH